jgi:hypothetical protein
MRSTSASLRLSTKRRTDRNLPTRDEAITFRCPWGWAEAFLGNLDLVVPAVVEQAAGRWGEQLIPHEPSARHSYSETQDAT